MSNVISEIRSSCERLHKDYLELKPRNESSDVTFEQLREKASNWIKSGKLVVDFYREFSAKYSGNSDEGVLYANKVLRELSYLAKQALGDEDYMGLGTVLLPWGSQRGDSDKLEALIERLSEFEVEDEG